jgi:hypothetical protein
MAEYMQVWRAKVAEDSVERLLELEPAAIAEAQGLCPELLGANLVRLEDGTWLHVPSRAAPSSRPGRTPSPPAACCAPASALEDGPQGLDRFFTWLLCDGSRWPHAAHAGRSTTWPTQCLHPSQHASTRRRQRVLEAFGRPPTPSRLSNASSGPASRSPRSPTGRHLPATFTPPDVTGANLIGVAVGLLALGDN